MGQALCSSFQALLGIHFLQKTSSLWAGHPHLPSGCEPAKWASDAAAVDEQEEGCQLRHHPMRMQGDEKQLQDPEFREPRVQGHMCLWGLETKGPV